MMTVAQRFLKYTGFETTSCETSESCPSTPGQMELARALVEGRRLVIAGGDYALCPHAAGCAGRDCVRRGCGRRCGCGGCSQHKNGGK